MSDPTEDGYRRFIGEDCYIGMVASPDERDTVCYYGTVVECTDWGVVFVEDAMQKHGLTWVYEKTFDRILVPWHQIRVIRQSKHAP